MNLSCAQIQKHVLLSSVLYIRKWPDSVLSLLFDTSVYRAPVRTQPLLGTSHPCVFPPPSPPSPSAYPACPVSPGNAPPPPFLPPSLPPHPHFTAVWAFITPLPPSSFYLSVRMKESVREYVWGSIPCVHNCLRVCVGEHLCVFVCTCVFVCASVSLYMWLKFCWL